MVAPAAPRNVIGLEVAREVLSDQSVTLERVKSLLTKELVDGVLPDEGELREIFLDLLYHLCRFAWEESMGPHRLVAALAIVCETHRRSMEERLSAEQSFQLLQGLRTFFPAPLLARISLSQFRSCRSLFCGSPAEKAERAPPPRPLAEAVTETEWRRRVAASPHA